MSNKTVYLTMKNSDMTEGRGPMISDKCFSNRESAAEYIDRQPGCMGRKAKWSAEKYGDWEIKELYVYDHFNEVEEKAEKRLKILQKLSKEEREILGV